MITFFLEKNMSFEIDGKTLETDEEGYLLNLADWTTEAAAHLAEEEKVTLTDNHWEVLNFLREYYMEYQIAPAVRVLTKAIVKKFGPEKGNSKYLYDLFPYGPAKQACKIAGLPKPTGCISVSYTHLRAHETGRNLVCRLLLEKKKIK